MHVRTSVAQSEFPASCQLAPPGKVRKISAKTKYIYAHTYTEENAEVTETIAIALDFGVVISR
jgi:hypothetical protein